MIPYIWGYKIVTMDNLPTSPMPQYQCHKKVWALKIKEIKPYQSTPLSDDGKVQTQVVVEEPFAPIKVDMALVDKMKPEPGWYYVVYEDRYESFSPAESFEKGYTLIQ